MINKKIHADAIARREQLQPEPEVQKKLRATLENTFGSILQPLPNHCWEYGLTFGVKRADALELFRRLKDQPDLLFNFLIDITAVDWMDRREPRFEVVYQLMSLPHLHRLQIKITTDEDKPEVDSLRALWPAANFLEREVWDMYGINFAGHGDLRRILMYEEFVGHPLRKDYPIRGKQPRVPLRVPEFRNTAEDMQRPDLVALPVRRGSKAPSGAGH